MTRSPYGNWRGRQAQNVLADTRFRRTTRDMSGAEAIGEALKAIERNRDGNLAAAREEHEAIGREYARRRESQGETEMEPEERRRYESRLRWARQRIEALEVLVRNPKFYPSRCVLNTIPIIPIHMRKPTAAMSGENRHEHDLDSLYRRLVGTVHRIREGSIDKRSGPTRLAMATNNLYFGTTDRRTRRRRQGITVWTGGKAGVYGRTMEGFNVAGSMRGSMRPGGPDLPANTIEIPESAARKLFGKQVQRMLREAFEMSRKEARQAVRSRTPEAKRMLEVACAAGTALLNRPPTLYRHGMIALAMKPRFGNRDDKAIRLPIQLCVPYNGDFDGDAFRFWVLSRETAGFEAKTAIGAHKNLLDRATGKSLMTPTQGALSGLAHTLNRTRVKGDDVMEQMKGWIDSEGPSLEYAIAAFEKVSERELEQGSSRNGGHIVHDWCQEFCEHVVYRSEHVQGDALRRIQELWNTGYEYSADFGSSLRLEDLEQLREYMRQKSERIIERMGSVKLGSRPTEAKRTEYCRVAAECIEEAENGLNDLRDTLLRENPEDPALVPLIFADRGGRVNMRQLARITVWGGAPMDLAQRAHGVTIDTPLLESVQEHERAAQAIGVATSHAATQNALAKGTHIGAIGRDTAEGVLSVTTKDCKVRSQDKTMVAEYLTEADEGLILAENPKDFHGQRVRYEDGALASKGDIVTPKLLEAMGNKRLPGKVKVRRTASCQAPEGVCSMCVGTIRAERGNARSITDGNVLPRVGTNPGIDAWANATQVANQDQLRRFKDDGMVLQMPGPQLPDAIMHALKRTGRLSQRVQDEAARTQMGEGDNRIHRAERAMCKELLAMYEEFRYEELDPASARGIAACMVNDEGTGIHDIYEIGARRAGSRHTTHMVTADTFSARLMTPGMKIVEPLDGVPSNTFETELKAHWAAICGDVAQLRRMAEEQPELFKCRDAYGRTALWYARTAEAARICSEPSNDGLEPDSLGVSPADAALVRLLPASTETERSTMARSELIRAMTGGRKRTYEHEGRDPVAAIMQHRRTGKDKSRQSGRGE